MKWLKDIQENDISEVGKKAFELARLKRSGFPVPDAFVITHSTCLKIFSNRIGDSNRADVNRLIEENAVTGNIVDRILRGFQRLGPPIAVRSSAVKEDLEGASFAGQFETVLNIEEKNALLQAVRTCFASQFSERVREYAGRNKISLSELKLSVLVQKQVTPEASGVLFTVNPVTGNDREMVVEAVSGLGESLVAGKVLPNRYLLDGFSGRITHRELHFDPAGSFIKSGADNPTERIQLSTPLLDDKILHTLGKMALKIQALYGSPQDIEWAVSDSRIHILQSRPITTINYQGVAGEWTTADFRDGGVSSEAVTPFMWSLYEHVWEAAVPSYLKAICLISRNSNIQWSKVFFARPYWNVGAIKEALARLPGYKESNFDRDLGIEITYEGDGVVIPFKIQNILRAIPVILALERMYFRQTLRTRKAVRKFEEYERELMAEDLSALKNDELTALFVSLVHQHHFELETAYFKTVFNTSNARLDFKAAFDSANKKGAGLEYLPLITALMPLKTIIPLYELWKTSRRIRTDLNAMEVLAAGNTEAVLAHPILGKELKNFLRIYGHHSTRELDLRVARWREDPGFVIETLRSYSMLDDDNNPQRQAKSNNELYKKEMEKVRRFYSGHRILKRALFMRRLDRVRFLTWYKEEVRDQSTRMYGLIRKVSLEVGRRLTQKGFLSQPDHIFYLTYQEVIAILRDERPDPKAIRQRIEANQNYMFSFRNFKNPNEVGQRWQYQHGKLEKQADVKKVFRGIPCAQGKAAGRVRVIQDINQSGRLQPGDILVTRFTDPGWTPLFSLLSGVITETGGILSHAAVIAREYGVPAVLAVQNATRKLKDNQKVIVNGNNGEVQILC
ncbi:MAG: hypothetical protein JSV31_25380 [Desulfobacterales bacterium]|nr:MAG: hypothetical protein JSV31_25380 [Desulfobacterales bacterium]